MHDNVHQKQMNWTNADQAVATTCRTLILNICKTKTYPHSSCKQNEAQNHQIWRDTPRTAGQNQYRMDYNPLH